MKISLYQEYFVGTGMLIFYNYPVALGHSLYKIAIAIL